MNCTAVLVCLLALGCESSSPSSSSNQASAPAMPSAQPMQWAGPEPLGPWGDLAVSCAAFMAHPDNCLVCAVRETQHSNDQERVVCWWVKP